MINLSRKDVNENKSLSHQKEHFLTAFSQIAREVMNEYHSNIRKPIVKEVVKPNQTEEDLE